MNNIKVKKCKGYELTQIDNIYQNFPFQILTELNFVFENGKFHSLSCAANDYICYENEINKECSDLIHNNKIKDIIKRSN